MQTLVGVKTHMGRWASRAAAVAPSRRPQMTRRLDVPTSWSWLGAFTGEGEAPGFEGWALECCCRQLPEVFRLVNTMGFFSTRQNAQLPYPDFANYALDTVITIPPPGPGTLYWNSRDGRQSDYSDSGYRWDVDTSSSSRSRLSWHQYEVGSMDSD